MNQITGPSFSEFMTIWNSLSTEDAEIELAKLYVSDVELYVEARCEYDVTHIYGGGAWRGTDCLSGYGFTYDQFCQNSSIGVVDQDGGEVGMLDIDTTQEMTRDAEEAWCDAVRRDIARRLSNAVSNRVADSLRF